MLYKARDSYTNSNGKYGACFVGDNVKVSCSSGQGRQIVIIPTVGPQANIVVAAIANTFVGDDYYLIELDDDHFGMFQGNMVSVIYLQGTRRF
jgi:hypothetical protein